MGKASRLYRLIESLRVVNEKVRRPLHGEQSFHGFKRL